MSRPKPIKRNCTHCDAPGGPVLIGDVEHTFFLEEDLYPLVASTARYRWTCSCSSIGRWMYEYNYPYHAWLKHLDRERMSNAHLDRERMRR